MRDDAMEKASVRIAAAVDVSSFFQEPSNVPRKAAGLSMGVSKMRVLLRSVTFDLLIT